jgi:hypothetical protein
MENVYLYKFSVDEKFSIMFIIIVNPCTKRFNAIAGMLMDQR